MLSVARETGLFQPDELEGIAAMAGAHFQGETDESRWDVLDDEGVSAVAYYAPEPFTEGVWNLYMLVVDPAQHGKGQGQALVRHVEDEVAKVGARVLLIETSGVPEFERQRSFYEKLGYEREATVRDYYGPGDDKVIYWKAFGQ